MRVAILSDIHANIEALSAVMGDIARRRVDQLVCLGDVVGYHTNPVECVTLVREMGMLCVAGNHDRAVTDHITLAGFCNTAARAVGWTRTHLDCGSFVYLSNLPLRACLQDEIVAVHGALHPDSGCETVRLNTDVLRLASIEALMLHPCRARICAFGHTHRVEAFEARGGSIHPIEADRIELRDDAWYLLNPGSVGHPRSPDTRATYMLVDTDARTVDVHRVAYDDFIPREKTRNAGLGPLFPFLHGRLREQLKKSAGTLGLSG